MQGKIAKNYERRMWKLHESIFQNGPTLTYLI